MTLYTTLEVELTCMVCPSKAYTVIFRRNVQASGSSPTQRNGMSDFDPSPHTVSKVPFSERNFKETSSLIPLSSSFLYECMYMHIETQS